MPATAIRAAFDAVPLTVSNNRPVYGSTGLTHEHVPVNGQPPTVLVDYVRVNEALGVLKVTTKNVLPAMPGTNTLRDLVVNLPLGDDLMRIEKQLAAQLTPEQVLAKSSEIRIALAAWLLKTVGA